MGPSLGISQLVNPRARGRESHLGDSWRSAAPTLWHSIVTVWVFIRLGMWQ
jgi:hypothetical protein